MSRPHPVTFYLDFVSPYTWLALLQAERFGDEHAVLWELHPIVYAALLDAHGLVGPVESPAKRRYTLHDVARCAQRLGIELTGPPAHPFRSLEALRTLCIFRRTPEALRLAVLLANACWGEGKSLTDFGVLREAVQRAGLDSAGLAERIASAAAKQDLRELTQAAIGRGVFGVPTFALADELFWGHDRLEHLAARLAGAPPPSAELVRALLERPRGVERVRR